MAKKGPKRLDASRRRHRSGASVADPAGAPREDAPEGRRWRYGGWRSWLILLAGLGFAVVAITYQAGLSSKEKRLRADGVPVVARVVDSFQGSGRGGGADTVTLEYEYRGARYRGTVLCGGATGCADRPAGEMAVRVDPERPAEFLADNGHTDDSVSFLNSWTVIPASVMVFLIGLISVTLSIRGQRRSTPRRTRRARPGRGPGRPEEAA